MRPGRWEACLDIRDAQVWTDRIAVRGRAEGADFARLAVVVDGRPFPFAPRRGSFEVVVPLHEGDNRVRVVGLTAGGHEVSSERVHFHVPLGRAAPGAERPWPDEPRPAQPAERVCLYGIPVHLLSDRGLAGVTDALDRVAELGCNAIWLNPIFPTARGGHGYDVTDYFQVRPDYGTLDELRRLTRQAHGRGIRVLLDLVPNHTSAAHPYFLDALRHGEASHYRDFYLWEAPGRPRHYFHWDHLPNLNYDHPEVRRMMMEVARFWIGRLGVDGFRVDAAWGVLERRPGFWREWIAEVRRIHPGAVLIAEAPGPGPPGLRAPVHPARDPPGLPGPGGGGRLRALPGPGSRGVRTGCGAAGPLPPPAGPAGPGAGPDLPGVGAPARRARRRKLRVPSAGRAGRPGGGELPGPGAYPRGAPAGRPGRRGKQGGAGGRGLRRSGPPAGSAGGADPAAPGGGGVDPGTAPPRPGALQ